VGFELGSNNSLKDLGQEGEIGDGPVVVGNIRVKTRLLKYGGNGSELESRGDSTSRQGGVDYACDEWSECGG